MFKLIYLKPAVHLLVLIPFLSACSQKATEKPLPNILLILADDLGFGDISCYGGDIRTPNIDALAKQGILFTRFHTAPMCAPTRAMLLTGNDNHIAGIGIQGRRSKDFGYEGHLTNRVVTIPEMLLQAGYHTYMAGKWHLGRNPEFNPHQRGFERSFALLPGAGNHYSAQNVLGKGLARYTENGDSTSWTPGAYSTDFYTDKLISYIDENAEDDQPFFAYAAYTSPHWPLQVDEKHWKKFTGRYDEGYEKLREKRLNSLKSAGIIPQEVSLPALHPSVTPWDSLSAEAQRKEARKMELYAGMVDNLDFNIGRLITYLKEKGMYENTLFVFLSDNGAAYRDFINADSYKVLREYYNDDYENMGKENSYISYGPQWAEAGSAPFRYFKDYATEGGMNTTMIVAGPGVLRKNEIQHEFTTLVDLAPTFYEIAELPYPEEKDGNRVYPLKGKSILDFLGKKVNTIHESDYVFSMEHAGNAMVRKGDWKITNHIKPFSRDSFRLYNIAEDIGEQIDLRFEEPDIYQELLGHWDQYAKEVQLKVTSKGVD